MPFCLQELGSFLALETREELVVDRSAQGELLRINFNISYPSLSCEFATLDVSDALGTVRLLSFSLRSHRLAVACMDVSTADRILSQPLHCDMCQRGQPIATSAVTASGTRGTVAGMCSGLDHLSQCSMQKRMNLTKTIRKLPITEDGQRAGYYVHDDLSNVNVKYDEPQVDIPDLALVKVLLVSTPVKWYRLTLHKLT